MTRFFAGLVRWMTMAIAFALPAPLAEPAGVRAPPVRRVLFVVVSDPSTPGATFTRADYDEVLSRAARALARETFGAIDVRYDVVESPIGSARGYATHSFFDWFAALADATSPARYDVLAFGPDRSGPWCSDAHSLGVVVRGTAFTCLEAPKPLVLATNLFIHKLFHTFGFFHQQLRNKQLRLLDWELGLPSYTEVADIVDPRARDDVDRMMFLSPMTLDAIAAGALRCDQPGDAFGECRDVVGPFSWDIDRDGVRDDVDGYPVTPPHGGPDSDHDGVPDALDLCPGSEVVVRGANGGPMNFWSTAAFAGFSVTSAGKLRDVSFTLPSIDVGKQLGDLIYFDDARETAGEHVPTGVPPTRVRVDYDYRGALRRHTFYLYGPPSITSPGPWAYFDEKEWFYFGRFGCDPPATLDVFDRETFDADGDGFPDARLVPFDPKVFATYDWDGDGVPDRDDTLPTVAGTCSDAYVRGVKDTDGDGFCDPGRLVFDRLPKSVQRASYFGEIPTGMGDDPSADRCPYVMGPDQGCPSDWY